ncbi:MAG: F0F1 ATP synthase subunit B [Candidatus Omnitrophica bacterium]|nr:F0F1 ATP synthase subunit B [Candidatus Omnitrophota bacterium]
MENTAMEHSAAASSGANILTPDILMVVLTWVTFFILLFILQKFAFKPIMENLQKREKDIREALENADKAKAQIAEIEAEKQRILIEAKVQASLIIDGARKAAKELAADVEAKSKQQAQDIVKAAHEEIIGERQRLLKSLRQESAEVAISLASKIIQENMDQDKNRRLVQDAIEKL